MLRFGVDVFLELIFAHFFGGQGRVDGAVGSVLAEKGEGAEGVEGGVGEEDEGEGGGEETEGS